MTRSQTGCTVNHATNTTVGMDERLTAIFLMTHKLHTITINVLATTPSYKDKRRNMEEALEKYSTSQESERVQCPCKNPVQKKSEKKLKFV